MELPKKIRVREVGPREGFQILNRVFSTKEKAGLIDILSESGLKEIEITSFVKKDKVPQMADAEDLAKAIKKKPDIRYTALYLNPEGFKRAENAEGLSNEAWISAACSNTFLKKNANTSLDEIISKLSIWLSTFKEYNKPLHGLMLSTSFGCAYEGPVDAGKLISIISKLSDAIRNLGEDFKEICLADTIGIATPEQVKQAIKELKTVYPEYYISLHLHDTNARGLENVEAGLELGIDCFDSSIGGMGGCPFTQGAKGNIATEELLKLCESKGIATGLKLNKLDEAKSYIQNNLGVVLNSSVK